MSTKVDFNNFRFEGLNLKDASNKYFTMDRVSKDEKKIVVKVSNTQVLETKFGYALILNRNHVIFLKNWQISNNWFGVEVLLNKDYWNVKEWGKFDEFEEDIENLEWTTWFKVAKDQNGVNIKVINKIDGEVDRAFLPLENYFKPTQCSPGAPKWTPHIENGKWYFSDTYSHVLPKENDYMNLAAAIDQYIILFE